MFEPWQWEEVCVALGQRIRELRTARGWTQEEAAEAAGLVVRHYQKVEAGEVNLTIRTIVRLANAFKLEPASLLMITRRI
jgi:transcriptional regulator with XRE-family HTH domain